VGKYGTNLEGFGAFEGGVNSDKGAPLISTNSAGETALLFGAAALREIQGGVANGDFAIPPDAAGDTITDENGLPYWTFTDVNSGGLITCAVAVDAATSSSNVLKWTVASGTTTGKSAKITRYIPISSTLSRSFSYYIEASFTDATNSAQSQIEVSGAFYKTDLTVASGSFTSGTVPFSSLTSTTGVTAPANFDSGSLLSTTAPSDAAYLLLTVTISTTATQSADRTIELAEVNLFHGSPELLLTDRSAPQTYQPAVLQADGGELLIQSDNGNSLTITATKSNFNNSVTTTGSVGFDAEVYGSSALTGPNLNLAGTNGQLWSFSNSTGAADVAASTSTTRSGILITKPTAGPPTENINGTGTTDAFADALRNGGIAVDTTNNRAYFYDSGWKYANLTTPSDSRLKEEITEITGALNTLRQLVPVAFKWKAPEAHGRTDAVADEGKRLGFIADQVATTDLAHWVETLGVDKREAHLVDTAEVLAINIPQNEMEALVVQALLDIDTRLKALEAR
jgi:hypothetical protein